MTLLGNRDERLQNHKRIQWWRQGSRLGVQSPSLILGASEELFGASGTLVVSLHLRRSCILVKDGAILGHTTEHLNLKTVSFPAPFRCSLLEASPAERRPQQDGCLVEQVLAACRAVPIAQLVVSRRKARAETIWRAHFPPFPPALLCLKQLVWFHMYYFPCQKMTPTRNRIREVDKGRENVIIGQTSIPSPRTLGFSCHFWCLLSISDICLACSFSSDDIFFYSSVVALVYRFWILMG